MQNCIKLFGLVSSAILGNLSKLVDTGDYCTLQGFTIVDHVGTVLKKGTVDDLPCVYSHQGYAKLTWNWKSHIDEMNAAAGDYHLRVGSPCVNGVAMLDYKASSIDLDGNPRIFNFGKRSGKPDMGCYESPYGTPGMLLLFR